MKFKINKKLLLEAFDERMKSTILNGRNINPGYYNAGADKNNDISLIRTVMDTDKNARIIQDDSYLNKIHQQHMNNLETKKDNIKIQRDLDPTSIQDTDTGMINNPDGSQNHITSLIGANHTPIQIQHKQPQMTTSQSILSNLDRQRSNNNTLNNGINTAYLQ